MAGSHRRGGAPAWLIAAAGLLAVLAIAASAFTLAHADRVGGAQVRRQHEVLAAHLASTIADMVARARNAAATLPLDDVPADRRTADAWLATALTRHALEPWLDVRIVDVNGAVLATHGGPARHHRHEGEGVLDCGPCLLDDHAIVVRDVHAGRAVEVLIALDRIHREFLRTSAARYGLAAVIAPPASSPHGANAAIANTRLAVSVRADPRLTQRPLRVALALHALAILATVGALAFLIAIAVREQRRRVERERVELEARHQGELALAHTRRLAVLGEMTAGVAHELANPINVVLMNLSMLRSALDGRDSSRLAEAEAYLSSANTGAERVAEFVRTMRRFTHRTVERGPVDVRTAIESAVVLTSTDRRNPAPVAVSIGEVPAATASEPELVQILVNLVNNARHAMRELDEPRRRIEIRCQSEGDHVSIDVTDQGPGFSSEALEHLGEPFFTTKPVGEGTGLGLSISRGLARAFGGDLVATNLPGGGAKVTVRLLVHDAGNGAARTEERRVPVRRPRVLVIDDDELLARSVALRMDGECEVQIARDGRDALEILLRDSAFDRVLCDVRMPRLSGPALFERLARLRPELGGRFAFHTGDPADPELRALAARVPLIILEKPVATDVLFRWIRAGAESRTTGPHVRGH